MKDLWLPTQAQSKNIQDIKVFPPKKLILETIKMYQKNRFSCRLQLKGFKLTTLFPLESVIQSPKKIEKFNLYKEQREKKKKRYRNLLFCSKDI